MNPYLVVMAGGSGTRFWPKSTSKKPKQLLRFSRNASDPTLLSRTLSRFDGMISDDRKWILTTEKLQAAVKSDATRARILAEPEGRNTAPCLYWAARELQELDSSSIMVVMPSDHEIIDLPEFKKVVQSAIEWAKTHNDLITLGVRPTRAETGYGYLKLSKDLPSGDAASKTPIALEKFVEKPNLEKAKEFVSSGRYLWNGGMFVWKTSALLAAFDRFMPEMRIAWEKNGGKVERAYRELTATSIDYGILEKSSNVVTFLLDCGWDDLGSWTSLESVSDRLKLSVDGGVAMGGEVIALRSKGNIIDAPGRVVALLDVDDLIIVEQGDALMIARKSSAQDIKLLVDAVKQKRSDLV